MTQNRRQELYDLLGDLPPRDVPMNVKTVRIEEKETYTIEYLILNPSAYSPENPDGEPIPAYFIRPKGEGPYPAVLFSHSHGGLYQLGKDELFHPAPYMYPVPYAEALTKLGCAVLAIDHWNFGERSGRIEQDTFKDMLWKGQVLWGKMVWDSLKALDYLAGRKDVDARRIGALGMSMGATMSWWVSALDERISFCADICCFTEFEALKEDYGLSRHGIYYFVPGLLRHFTAGQINSLIAPRKRLATVGLYDGLNPIPGVDRMEKEVRECYNALHAPREAFNVRRYPCGHRETAEMRQDILDFVKSAIEK